MTTRRDMLAPLQRRRAGDGLPRPFYTDPEFFKVDTEMLRYRERSFAAHAFELPAAGNSMTIQIGGCPVLIVRDRSGEIPRLRAAASVEPDAAQPSPGAVTNEVSRRA